MATGQIEISHNLPILGLFTSEKDLSYEPHCIKTRQLIFLSPEYSKPLSFIFPKTYLVQLQLIVNGRYHYFK